MFAYFISFNRFIIKIIALLILFFLASNSSVFSQTKPLVVKNSELTNLIDDLKTDPALTHASWGFYAWNIEKSTLLCEYNSEIALIPASTLKIVTTAAALGLFGTDFTFNSSLSYRGEIDSLGTLNGDIVFIGSGDPSLASDRIDKTNNLETLMLTCLIALKKTGIKKINGQIIADASIFDNDPLSPQWLWCDIGNYYGAGASGININENYFKINFKSGINFGDSVSIISIEPNIKNLNFDNQVTTGASGSGDNVIVYGAPYSNYRVLTGTIPGGRPSFSIKASNPDPPMFLATSLHKYLSDSGVVISKDPSTNRILKKQYSLNDTSLKTICIIKSPPLGTIVYHTNIKSINSYAETLLKYCGTTIKKGSYDSGIEAIQNYWINKGIDLDGFVMKDGSGLSPVNRITTKQLAKILTSISKQSYFKSFENSLPVAGKSGSIASLFKGTTAEGNLKAKSGYLSNVRAYAGYVLNKSNQNIAFAIIVNNYDGSKLALKSKLENFMIKIAESE